MGRPLLIGEPNSLTSSEAAVIGFVAGLLVSTERASLSLLSLDAWLRTPTRLGQIALVFGERGTPLAFASWAFVSRRTAKRLGGGATPMPEDWNDGDLLWIVDIVAPHNNVRPLIDVLRQGPGAGRTEFGFASRRGGGRSMRLDTIAGGHR